MKGDWDYIVVGGGSAGCVVASRLSEDPSKKVLLLDAGRPDNHLYTRVPAGQMLAFTRPDMNWLYEAEPDPTLNQRVNMWPAGKLLGGGSAINGMMYVRGHRNDYDRWASLGNTGWGYEDVLPYFRRLESFEGGGNAFRGGEGPQRVSSVRYDSPLNRAFVDAAKEVGIPYQDDLNGALAEGVGFCQVSQSRGWRHSTAQAYIRPNRRRANLSISYYSQANKILFEAERATGVEFSRKGQLQEVRAKRGVIVCAGAMASPKLLMLSGVGDEAQLNEHGIEVHHELPGVGCNLQEHAVAGIGAHIRNARTITSDTGLLRSLWHGINYLFRGRGPLSTSIGHAQAFIRTKPELEAPDAQIIFAPLAYELTPKGPAAYKRPAVGIGVGLCSTGSFGEIRLRSKDPTAAPIIDYQLLACEEDVETLIRACRITRSILQTEAFQPFYVDEREPGMNVQTDQDWRHILREQAGLMFHPCGTCKMGQDDLAVVDERLRVRGLKNLWVADASIMPTIPAGNINASCIMIGEKAADLIKEEVNL